MVCRAIMVDGHIDQWNFSKQPDFVTQDETDTAYRRAAAVMMLYTGAQLATALAQMIN